VVLLLVEAGLALASVMSVMVTDGCGSGTDVAAVCNTTYFGATLFGYWTILGVTALTVPITLVMAAGRRERTWPWPLAGAVVVAASSVGFVGLLSR
jgi:hypothetical protein